MFTVRTRSPDSRARTGTLHLAHGDVQTPAFVPLATKGAVKTLEPRDVAEIGGLHEFMRWDRAIITDSGGFQVFSMGHGGVADEIKGRGRPAGDGAGAILSIFEEGVRFRSYVDGGERFLSPEGSMEVQAAL